MYGNGESRRRVVVVTGGTAGVGRATVRMLAERGDRIGILARGTDALDAASREAEDLGGEVLAVPTDVADAEQVESAAAAIERELGPIDVWVNNAMTSVFARFVDVEPAEFRRVTEVAYLGFVYGTMSALRRMVPRDRGVIVQVRSALARRAIPLQSAYCGAQHAIKGFTESIRAELLHDNSRVQITMVQLPGLNTPQFRWVRNKLPEKAQPVPPIFQPEVAARAILYAMDHPRRVLNVGRSTTMTVLGEKFVPGYVDRYLARSGLSSQQSGEPADRSRRDNLWEPVPGDHGAHGAFDDRAGTRSPQFWATTHRGLLAGIGAGLAAATAAALFARRRS